MRLFSILPLALVFSACAITGPHDDDVWLADQAASAVLAGAGAIFGDVETGRVDARSTSTWDVTLQAGVTKTIEVRGDGSTNLDIYLYDENGNLIDFDESSSDYGAVSVTPRWTGKFYIVVVNHGWVYNDFTLRLF